MQHPRRPVSVAVNTMRARLTILGFDLAMITFKITDLLRHGARVEAGTLPSFLPELVALHVSAALCVSAMVAFIASGQLSETGSSDHWSILVGDMLMYAALAYTVVGFFHPLFLVFERHEAAEPGSFEGLGVVRRVLAGFAAACWVLVAAVGPAVTLLRSPFARAATFGVGVGYVVLFAALSALWYVASVREVVPQASGRGRTYHLHDFIPPLAWF